MTPNAANETVQGTNEVDDGYNFKLPTGLGTDWKFRRDIVWPNAIGFLFLHLAGAYGVYRLFFYCKWTTTILSFLLAFTSGLGVTIGAHRYYSHRSFKASFIVRLLFIIMHTIAGQNCLYIWVRDHRQHHKYSDTDADPHNANRGFFFSHVGWLMTRKHPDVIEKGKDIGLKDLEDDWLVMLQKKYYKQFYVIFAMIIPMAIPYFVFGESFTNCLFCAFFARYVLMLNVTWLVNSAAHLYGTRPYDKGIKPVENALVSILSQGEGWHNYHHAFPWDYRAAEFGIRISVSTLIINTLAAAGLAWDLKYASPNMVEQRIVRTGDGTHEVHSHHMWRKGFFIETPEQPEDCKKLKYPSKKSANEAEIAKEKDMEVKEPDNSVKRIIKSSS